MRNDGGLKSVSNQRSPAIVQCAPEGQRCNCLLPVAWLPSVLKPQYFRTAFFENLVADNLAFAQFFLLLIWQGINILTCRRAALIHFSGTGLALNEKEMTGLIRAIYMGITRSPALMALGDYVRRYPFAAPMIKNKVLAQKFVFKIFIIYLPRVFYNAAFKLVYLLKTLVFIVGAGLFASDAPCAVHNQLFVLLVPGKFLFYNIQ